jgi:recombination protein RecR
LKKIDYPEPVRELIRQLRRMPAIGPRSAERIALWMIQSRDSRTVEISDAIVKASSIRTCSLCGFFCDDTSLCAICSSPDRERQLLCVVEQPTDILPLERTGAFRGLYHALGGKLSPLDHVSPEDLRIETLQARIKQEPPQELILALSADVEGEATAHYLVDLLTGTGTRMTRIAQGLSVGLGLENADELTITRAFSGRTPLH